MWIFTRDFSSPSTSKVEKKTNVEIKFFMIRNDFAPKRLSVPRLESKPAPEQTLQKWRLPSKKSKTDPVQALQCNAWEPRQAQNSDPTQEERSLKESMLWQWIPTNHFYPSFVPFIKVKLYSRKGWRVISFFWQVLWCPHWSWKQHIEADRGSRRTIGTCLRQSGESAFQCSEVDYKYDKQESFT